MKIFYPFLCTYRKMYYLCVMVTEKQNDKVCDECGLIHKNGLDWHGRCYNCGGDLVEWEAEDHELTAVTPKGIEIYNQKQ